MKNFKVYQLPVKHNAKFMDLEFVRENDIMPKLEDYNLVGESVIYPKADTSVFTMLDDIYATLNTCECDWFHGHSLSMSDVVEIDGKYYYCDDFGWEEISFHAESKEHIVTLTEENIHFAKKGDLLHGNIKVGSWTKTDVWKEHGGTRDLSGNKLVPFIYWINIALAPYTSTAIPFYSRKEAKHYLNGRKVVMTLPY